MLKSKLIPPLSKSKFMEGIQCHKRLYLSLFNRELAAPVSDATQAIFDQGHRVGVLAQTRFPEGVLVSEDHMDHKGAMGTTEKVIADPSLPSIYEGAFRYDDIRIRADILVRDAGMTFDLVEVKSSTGVKPENEWDLAIQHYVLTGVGQSLGRSCLMHINIGYVYQGGEHDAAQLFTLVDLTESTIQKQSSIPGLLEAMREPLSRDVSPDIPIGDHCYSPYECPYIEHCHPPGPEHPVTELPRISRSVVESLESQGVWDIPGIPKDYNGLNDLQRRIRDSVISGQPYVDPAITSILRGLIYPVYFIDFETFNPAIPLYVGTRPYQQIPFQWSSHVMSSDGSIDHQGFLHNADDDPRPPFIESLLKVLGDSGSIVVYSHFEKTQLRGIGEAYPAYSEAINRVIDRLEDLLPLIRNHVYYPEFHGSFSIKSVLPAVVPGLGYDDLAITDGSSASAAFMTITNPSTPSNQRDELRSNLLGYCKRDTEAMVELYRKLKGGD